ncbi:uncharacterized protein Z518_11216 [Rhinocladiella mackenziei CBS 650.93]|uniref:Uncharacterized protein n=1 Tax=Rhinocladiella mackenziei CBS 650.93 TaxID=1442369 RepID=A0A0D2GM80_9EURO|nr:uncharacterized protein Z518_11216 [Rhinocladiella mackenziei CBS 650.93]KIW99477.1 hypothetical protein Z518_11216 [Rhinocladiella mackenziei CBS 650.93]
MHPISLPSPKLYTRFPMNIRIGNANCRTWMMLYLQVSIRNIVLRFLAQAPSRLHTPDSSHQDPSSRHARCLCTISPKNIPYSIYPVIASSLPQSLKSSNPNLRVHIPDPWGKGLQLFGQNSILAKFTQSEFEPVEIQRIRLLHTLAPPGSTFDFAWNMFRKFFKQRVGCEWEAREGFGKSAHGLDGDREGRIGGDDGADDDRFFEFLGPVISTQHGLDNVGGRAETIEGKERRPSVTVVMNTNELVGHDPVDIKAKTPEGGWRDTEFGGWSKIIDRDSRESDPELGGSEVQQSR